MEKKSYLILSYPPLGYPAENPSHDKVPLKPVPRLEPIPSHGMGPMGRVHGMGYPISFRPLIKPILSQIFYSPWQ